MLRHGTPGRQQELTLKDRLSRLTLAEACKLLGPGADRLIRGGGAREIRIDEQVYLSDDHFRLSLENAVATIAPLAAAPQQLHWSCTRCRGACEHVGAAFSLILEEKMALGLAAPPPERVPIESLSEEALVARAVAERKERARSERMTVRSMDSKVPWTDYVVTNAASGKTYRVALRGWEAGESYCTCPDFRKNTLGTCKHVLAVQRRVSGRFSAAVRSRPYRQPDFAVHLRYGPKLELRLLAPARLEARVAKVAGPLTRGPVNDARDLVKRIGQLESLGIGVTVYPDAEEYIRQRDQGTAIPLRARPVRHAAGEQRIARAHRMGQKRPVQVYILVTEGTLEENLLGTLSAKHDLALAALDAESNVDTLDLVNGASELKNRLEVLLGRAPDAPLDRSGQDQQTVHPERLTQREKVSLAAGELLAAAFGFVDELLPAAARPSPESQRLARTIRERLDDCLMRDADGATKLTVTLPDPTAVERLSATLARLLAAAQTNAGRVD